MARKGMSESITTIIKIIVLFLVALILFIVLNGYLNTAGGAVGSKDPSMGTNTSLKSYCENICNADPDGDECIKNKAPGIEISCSDYLKNIAKYIGADYPKTLGVGTNIIRITLSYKDTPIPGATISGNYISDSFVYDLSTGTYKGSIKTNDAEGAGHLELTASHPDYPSTTLSFLVDKSAAVLNMA